MQNQSPSVRTEIISLLGVLLSGLVVSLMIIGYLLYAYGPTGQYLAANLMPDPTLLNEGKIFVDYDAGKGKEGRLVSDGLRFRYYDVKSNRWQVKSVMDAEYAAIYSLLGNDKSVENLTEDELNMFQKEHLSSLQVMVKPVASKSSEESQVFVSIDFIPDADFYRVSLRTTGLGYKYAYFIHKGVYKEILNNYLR